VIDWVLQHAENRITRTQTRNHPKPDESLLAAPGSADNDVFSHRLNALTAMPATADYMYGHAGCQRKKQAHSLHHEYWPAALQNEFLSPGSPGRNSRGSRCERRLGALCGAVLAERSGDAGNAGHWRGAATKPEPDAVATLWCTARHSGGRCGAYRIWAASPTRFRRP
jgi:hypothetical protein